MYRAKSLETKRCEYEREWGLAHNSIYKYLYPQDNYPYSFSKNNEGITYLDMFVSSESDKGPFPPEDSQEQTYMHHVGKDGSYSKLPMKPEHMVFNVLHVKLDIQELDPVFLPGVSLSLFLAIVDPLSPVCNQKHRKALTQGYKVLSDHCFVTHALAKIHIKNPFMLRIASRDLTPSSTAALTTECHYQHLDPTGLFLAEANSLQSSKPCKIAKLRFTLCCFENDDPNYKQRFQPALNLYVHLYLDRVPKLSYRTLYFYENDEPIEREIPSGTAFYQGFFKELIDNRITYGSMLYKYPFPMHAFQLMRLTNQHFVQRPSELPENIQWLYPKEWVQ